MMMQLRIPQDSTPVLTNGQLRILSKWTSEYVHKRRTINLFLNQEKTVAASD
jgi:hypothetical protein